MRKAKKSPPPRTSQNAATPELVRAAPLNYRLQQFTATCTKCSTVGIAVKLWEVAQAAGAACALRSQYCEIGWLNNRGTDYLLTFA